MNQLPLSNYGTIGIVIFLIIIIWSIIWKGIALWKAARNGHTAWFVVLMIVNTVGILEIIYILAFSKPKKETV